MNAKLTSAGTGYISLDASTYESLPSVTYAVRKVVRFDDFLHLDNFPVAAGNNEFRIYLPGANQPPATVVELTRLPHLASVSLPSLTPVMGLAAMDLVIEAPRGTNTHWVYLLMVVETELLVKVYDGNGNQTTSFTTKPIPQLQRFGFGFRDVARKVRIEAAYGMFLVTRVEGGAP